MPEMYIGEVEVLIAGIGGVVSPGVARPCEKFVVLDEIWRSSRTCLTVRFEAPGESR